MSRMSFLFVLGSNYKLSLAELDAFLKSEQYKGKIIDYSSNIGIVQFDNLGSKKYYVNELETLQYYLGGTQKIAKVFDFIGFHSLKQAFPERINNFSNVKQERRRIKRTLNKILNEAFPTIEDENMFFAVSIYPNLFNDDYYKQVLVKHFLPFLNKNISKILKKKNANKAIYFKYPEKNIRSGNLNPIFPHHVIQYELLKENRAEIIFGITEEGCYIARTFTVDDPQIKKKIDEKKPHKEFKSSIPPKLAIMMLNFLNLFEHRHQKKILDISVGNGDIALFALLEDFYCYGTDENKNNIQKTIRNIKWLQQELKLDSISNLEERFRTVSPIDLSSEFQPNFFDGIVSKPNLGPFYKNKPYYTEAKELINTKLYPLYTTLFQEAEKLLKPDARLVLIAPSISLIDDTKDLRLNIQELAQNNHFMRVPLISSERIVNKSNKVLQFRKPKLYSIMDAKKDQIIRRKIYVFQKQ
jgi:tRNA G10  N-methylase Trm11